MAKVDIKATIKDFHKEQLVDEFFIRHWYKGNHSKNSNFVMTREPRKSGISRDQLCIETEIDCKGNIVMGAVYNGRITTNEIVDFFHGK